MAGFRLTPRQSILLLVGVGAVCFAALVSIAVLPPRTSSAPPCPGCGTPLSSVVTVGPGFVSNSSGNHFYCFPVTSVKSSVWLYLIDAGFQNASGAWIDTNASFTLTYVSAAGATVASYQFLGSNASADDYSGWTRGGSTLITPGGEFCLGSGPYDVSGDTFVLAGNSFSPQGYVAQRIP